ncbi:MAG: histidine kinase [Chitinophagaceae bacterium]
MPSHFVKHIIHQKHVVLFALLLFICKDVLAKSFTFESKATCFLSTSSNTIFIGTVNGLLQYEERELKKISSFDGTNITSLFSVKNQLYVGTQQGEVFLYADDKRILLAKCETQISSIVTFDKKIIIGTKGSGLYIIQDGKKIKLNTTNSLMDDYINDIKQLNDKFLIATDNGINMLNPKDNAIRTVVLANEIEDPIVTSICVISNEEFLFGTSLGYVYQCNLALLKTILRCTLHENINYISKSKVATAVGIYDITNCSLLSKGNYINSITDSENNIWFLKSKELEFSSQKASEYAIQGFPNIKNVHSIFSNGETLFLTPDRGLLSTNKTNKFDFKHITSANKHIDITSFFLQNDTILWIGTMGDGLFRYHIPSGGYKQIKLDNSISSAGILSITGNKSALYISTLNGAWQSDSTFDNDIKFVSIEDKYNIKRSYVYQIKMDTKNRVWLATEGKGLMLIENNQLRSFNPNQFIKSKSFYSIDEDNQGNLFFGSDKEGLYVLKENKLFNLNENSGLYHNHILGICTYLDYAIILHDSSCTLLNSKNFQTTFYNYPIAYNTELNSVTNWQNTFLIGCDNGILSIPHISNNKNIAAHAKLTKILCNNKLVHTNQNVFNHQENNFVFRLSYQYNNPTIPIYARYKLIGYNNEWVETKDNLILFNMLGHGKYTLLYQISNNPSFQFPDEVHYDFEIKKPFWKHIWFWLLFGVGMYILIRSIIRYRIKQATMLNEIEQQKQLAEFDALKSQVNPHFLFNSFNSLLQIIENDKEQALEYTNLLSNLYRNILSTKDKDVILLEDELHTMHDFIKLHQVNLGDNLEIHVGNFKKDYYLLCPLTLQLLAENAIKHNTINKSNKLCIEVTIENEYLIVKNNINKKLTTVESEKIGLQNIQKRYLNITNQQVVIENNKEYFIVKIPLLIK